MGVRSTQPQEGPGQPVERWVYLPVPLGGTEMGFLAGPVLGIYCHTVGKRSKPCRALVSDGALSCPLCGKVERVWRGYVPIYDRDLTNRFVVIPREYFETVSLIERFSQVKLYRGKPATSPVVIRAENWRTTPIPQNCARDRLPDLVPTLLRMWRDDELSRWHAASDIPVSQVPDTPPPPVARVPLAPADELAKMKEQVRNRINWPGKDGAQADAPVSVGDVLNELPSRNGRHKPK